MAHMRNFLYKRPDTVEPWPLWGRLLFWTIMMGAIVDWIL
ncbi:MAG: hypothetical protein K0R31_1781 [Clostridiales bacterium]|jgi:hypothetical protein|nr:hypothetical protein [Clostridiales bacterium]MDF2636612.1 hypothetical protein [Pelosinus sp.]